MFGGLSSSHSNVSPRDHEYMYYFTMGLGVAGPGVLAYDEPPSMLECINTYDLNLCFLCVCVCVFVCFFIYIYIYIYIFTDIQ